LVGASKSSSLSLKVPATAVPVRRSLLEGGGLGLAADVGGDFRARLAATPPYIIVFLLGVAFLPEAAPPLSPPPPWGRAAFALSSSLHCDECKLWSSSDKLKLDSSDAASASLSLSLSDSIFANFGAGLFAIVPYLQNI